MNENVQQLFATKIFFQRFHKIVHLHLKFNKFKEGMTTCNSNNNSNSNSISTSISISNPSISKIKRTQKLSRFENKKKFPVANQDFEFHLARKLSLETNQTFQNLQEKNKYKSFEIRQHSFIPFSPMLKFLFFFHQRQHSYPCLVPFWRNKVGRRMPQVSI